MAVLLSPPSKNAIQKELSAQLLNTAGNGDPISFDDVDGIQNLPGVLVINRVDSNGTATPSKREYIEYSGTSGSTVIIETRNVDGSNAALTHAVGSIVEFIPDVVWADRIYDSLATLVDVDDISSINSDIATLSGTQTHTGAKTFSGGLTSSGTTTISSKRIGSINAIGNSGATKTIDLTDGETQSITITANTTLTLTNFAAGDYLTLFMDMDGTGGYTVDIAGSGVTFYSDGTTLTTTASARNVVGIRFVSATEARVFVNAGLSSITALT